MKHYGFRSRCWYAPVIPIRDNYAPEQIAYIDALWASLFPGESRRRILEGID